MHSKTIYPNYLKLKCLDKELAKIAIRLMMASNDINLSDYALSLCTESEPILKAYSWGAKVYFSRLQIGHVCEAFNIIKYISTRGDLLSKIEEVCKLSGKENLHTLLEYTKEPKKAEFERIVKSMRDHLCFHYNDKYINDAIEERLNRNEDKWLLKLTFSNYRQHTRFHVADDLIDSLLCRQLWGIIDEHAQEQADKNITFIMNISDEFSKFSFNFLYSLFEDNWR